MMKLKYYILLIIVITLIVAISTIIIVDFIFNEATKDSNYDWSIAKDYILNELNNPDEYEFEWMYRSVNKLENGHWFQGKIFIPGQLTYENIFTYDIYVESGNVTFCDIKPN